MTDEYPAVLEQVAESLGRCLVAAGAAAGAAIAGELIEHVRQAWGGRNLYVARRELGLFDAEEGGGPACLFADLARRVAEHLVMAGTPDGEAEATAARAIALFRAEWGREQFYLPKGRDIESERLAQAIWARYDGRNARSLAREFGLSDRRVQQIVEAMRERTIARLQLPLFGG